MLFKTNKKQKREILAVAFVVAVVQPLMVAPQVIQIFSNHSATDVSLLTWLMLLVFNASNLVYCLVFNIKPLVINNALWVVADGMVVAGVLLYR